MQDYLITFTVETVNIDAETLRARLVAFIESGALPLAESLREDAEVDPDTIEVSPID